jgi:tRNA threonylcarbamoyladenosine biosynthesis protein TsaB
MMRLLAVDASTWWGGAALLDVTEGRPRVVAEIGVEVGDSLAARLLPIVEALLVAAGWPKDSLDAYAAARGPGSFTGIRVALGLANGLALSASRPCVGVDTLSAMAEAFGPADAHRVPFLNAGRGEVYAARFDPQSSPPQMLRPPWVGEPSSALEPGVDVVVFGRGAQAHESRLRAAGYRRSVGRAETSVAAGAGRIALARLAAGTVDPGEIAPLYVRPSDAEVKFR